MWSWSNSDQTMENGSLKFVHNKQSISDATTSQKQSYQKMGHSFALMSTQLCQGIGLYVNENL